MKLEVRTSCALTLRMEGDTMKVEIADNRPESQSHGVWRGVKRLLRRVLPHEEYSAVKCSDSNRIHQHNICLTIHTGHQPVSSRGYTTSQASRDQGSGSIVFEELPDSLMSGIDPRKL